MYAIGKNYKIEMPNSIFYTAEILEEDTHSIRIKDRYDEELILRKESIVQAKRIGDRIGRQD